MTVFSLPTTDLFLRKSLHHTPEPTKILTFRPCRKLMTVTQGITYKNAAGISIASVKDLIRLYRVVVLLSFLPSNRSCFYKGYKKTAENRAWVRQSLKLISEVIKAMMTLVRQHSKEEEICNNCLLISRSLIGSFLSSIGVQTDKILIYASFQ